VIPILVAHGTRTANGVELAGVVAEPLVESGCALWIRVALAAAGRA
jgi:hypothetical protein